MRIVSKLTIVCPLLGTCCELIVPDNLAHILGTRLARIASGGHELPQAIVFLQDD